MRATGGEGFVGLNPTKAKEDIDTFEAAGMQVYNYVRDANRKFVSDLSSNWHSARAVNFATENLGNLYDAQNSIYRLINNLTVKAYEAYNALASSQGEAQLSCDRTALQEGTLPTDTMEDFDVDSTGSPFKEMDSGKNNEVGMYVTNVQTIIMPEWTNSITKVVETDLSAIPNTIAFYDTDGSIQLAYRTGIEAAQAALSAQLTAVHNAINSVVESEIDLTNTGASNSASALGGGTNA